MARRDPIRAEEIESGIAPDMREREARAAAQGAADMWPVAISEDSGKRTMKPPSPWDCDSGAGMAAPINDPDGAERFRRQLVDDGWLEE